MARDFVFSEFQNSTWKLLVNEKIFWIDFVFWENKLMPNCRTCFTRIAIGISNKNPHSCGSRHTIKG